MLHEYVYLRKQSSRGGRSDDEWKLEDIDVMFYGEAPNQRRFRKQGDTWLANEYGLQVWLWESRIE
jgi:hypothetical protein